ncbi:hypothetical protein RvY_15047 [Ramazzottius varieornatus]|uniref:G-protein coupled receptors family 1 profile domain-containing protein n=1 Tax=Ramazzottius varieornatus TaxID=947166 RepID=A0A1D1VTG7_RAMVA|nr:hypothetical protein RvY_15047 [Ramazzottius varieornatus]
MVPVRCFDARSIPDDRYGDYFSPTTNLTSANQTAAINDFDRCTFLPVYETAATPLGTILNAFVLVILVKKQRSKPSFNIYLIHLSISNLAFSTIIQPFEILNAVKSMRHWGTMLASGTGTPRCCSTDASSTLTLC